MLTPAWFLLPPPICQTPAKSLPLQGFWVSPSTSPYPDSRTLAGFVLISSEQAPLQDGTTLPPRAGVGGSREDAVEGEGVPAWGGGTDVCLLQKRELFKGKDTWLSTWRPWRAHGFRGSVTMC